MVGAWMFNHDGDALSYGDSVEYEDNTQVTVRTEAAE